MERECVLFRGEIKRQIRIDEEKGDEKEREGKREGYINIV